MIVNKIYIFAWLLFLLPFALFSQQNKAFQFVSEQNCKITLRFELPDYQFKSVQTPEGDARYIVAQGAGRVLESGAPDLPYFASSVIIDDTRKTTISISNIESEIISTPLIVPSKGNLIRTQNPSEVAYIFGNSYQTNAFLPKDIVQLNDPYIFRDFRGQTVRFNPFRYNAVTGQLQIISKAVIEIKTVNELSSSNPLFRSGATKISREFLPLYNHHFLNTGTKAYIPLAENGDLLIICHDAFMNAMQPFVDWKIRKGIKTSIVSVSSIGNSIQAIQSFINQQYLNNSIGYVILVGDIAQIASPTAAGGKSDPTYGMITGTDAYPEVIVGRLSAETVADVTTQVSRIVNYEVTPSVTNLFSKFIGIASEEGPGDDGELDYEHVRNIKNKLMSYHYTSELEFYEGTRGGSDQSGNPTATQVRDGINPGTGAIVYTGHGSSTSWGTSGFSNSNINSLSNSNCLPFIWSVACVNGEFDSGTCFAERWMRATNNGQAIGAVGAFMSSINQSWNPPMRAQDEMVDILRESYANNKTRTFGGISLNGCMNMNDVYGSAGDEMTLTWHIFGDPTMLVRTTSPLNMTVNHTPGIQLGTSSLSINCNVEGALVCFSMNNEIIARGFVQNGICSLSFAPLASVGIGKITVSAFNYTPYLNDIPVIAGSDPFISVVNWLAKDPQGTIMSGVNAGQSVGLNLSFSNIGNQHSVNVNAQLSTSSSFVTIVNGSCSIGDVTVGQTIDLDCFTISIADGTADQSVAQLLVTITDENGHTWTQPISIVINAPKIVVTSFTLIDNNGNNNGRLDLSETVTLSFWQKNTGHAQSTNGAGNLSPGNQLLAVTNNQPYASLAVNDSVYTQIQLTTTSSSENGKWYALNYTSAAGAYSDNLVFNLKIGGVFDPAENNNFVYDPVYSDSPWFIDNQEKFQGESSYRSGQINDGGFSVMEKEFTSFADDSISFMIKLSCEENWDFLKFYIDNDEKARWSGESGWQRVAFFVPEGLHTVKWEYAKDEIYNAGADAVWVDYIDYPATSSFSLSLESALKKDFKVYPNPFNQFVTIQIPGEQSAKSIQVIDITGRMIDFVELNKENTVSLSTSSWSSGIYLVKVDYFNGHTAVKRIVK